MLRTGRRHGERILVHRVTWDRDVDRDRTGPLQVARLGPHPEPTLARAEREVPAAAWQEQFAALRAGLAVPLDVPRRAVVDGCGHGLLLPMLHGVAVELRWNGEATPEWRLLGERVRTLREWLDAGFA